jgi:hypothetical protein
MPDPQATIRWDQEQYAPGKSAHRTYQVAYVPTAPVDGLGDIAMGATQMHVGVGYPAEPTLAIPPGGINAVCIAPGRGGWLGAGCR